MQLLLTLSIDRMTGETTVMHNVELGSKPSDLKMLYRVMQDLSRQFVEEIIKEAESANRPLDDVQ